MCKINVAALDKGIMPHGNTRPQGISETVSAMDTQYVFNKKQDRAGLESVASTFSLDMDYV
jgi:molybdopterin-guanine dinucleotide biosynthesis protein